MFNRIRAKKENPALVWAGHLFTLLGILGILLPVMPTTPFLIISLACYAEGSEKFHSWLINNKILGRYVREFADSKGLTMRTKIITCASSWLGTLISVFIFIRNNHLAATLTLIIPAGITVFIIMLPTRRA
jgi:uncharacterized membrane protein YbaN (DUF454 family)